MDKGIYSYTYEDINSVFTDKQIQEIKSIIAKHKKRKIKKTIYSDQFCF